LSYIKQSCQATCLYVTVEFAILQSQSRGWLKYFQCVRKRSKTSWSWSGRGVKKWDSSNSGARTDPSWTPFVRCRCIRLWKNRYVQVLIISEAWNRQIPPNLAARLEFVLLLIIRSRTFARFFATENALAGRIWCRLAVQAFVWELYCSLSIYLNLLSVCLR